MSDKLRRSVTFVVTFSCTFLAFGLLVLTDRWDALDFVCLGVAVLVTAVAGWRVLK